MCIRDSDKRDKDGRRFINPDGCTFYLSPAGPGEVEKIIDELNINKSIGPFGVPVFLLKNIKHSSFSGCLNSYTYHFKPDNFLTS